MEVWAHEQEVKYISLYTNKRRASSRADGQNTKDYKYQNSVFFKHIWNILLASPFRSIKKHVPRQQSNLSL
jgi:hypothetical protein